MAIEPLEELVMLDGGVGPSNPLPPAIVVGRTLSSYTVGGIQNNQETITYTVYNEQADPETGVLLTDTLAPGVTIASASQQPDQSGQNLAWSLGTIQGYDRASVTLTVNLPSPTPTAARHRRAGFRHPRRRHRVGRHARRDVAPGHRRPHPACLHHRRQWGCRDIQLEPQPRKGSVHVTAESSPIPW